MSRDNCQLPMRTTKVCLNQDELFSKCQGQKINLTASKVYFWQLWCNNEIRTCSSITWKLSN